jgi:hypothetical protein
MPRSPALITSFPISTSSGGIGTPAAKWDLEDSSGAPSATPPASTSRLSGPPCVLLPLPRTSAMIARLTGPGTGKADRFAAGRSATIRGGRPDRRFAKAGTVLLG